MHISRYERTWMYAAGVMIAVFAVVIGITFSHGLGFLVEDAPNAVQASAGGHGAHGAHGAHDGLDGQPVDAAAFTPGVVERAPGAFDVRVLGQMWMWTPQQIELPVGADVTFYVTSTDVMHGFEIEGTTVNASAIPGHVATLKYRFKKAGTYHVICNEYCGAGHALMESRVVVGGGK